MDSLRDYGLQIERWRSDVLRELKTVPPDDRNAAGFLHGMLQTSWTSTQQAWASRLAYNIRPFPEYLSSSDPRQYVFTLLAWRATFVDLLDDIWDTPAGVSPPLQGTECTWIGNWMNTQDRDSRCIFCLTQYPEGRRHPDDHRCLMVAEVRARLQARQLSGPPSERLDAPPLRRLATSTPDRRPRNSLRRRSGHSTRSWRIL